MNIIKKLENHNINIREIGILGAIGIFILHILSDFIMLPIYIGEIIFSIDSLDISFIIESAGSLIVKIIMVKWLLKKYSKKEEIEERENVTISKDYYVYAMVAILLFRIVFDNSISIILDQVPVNENIDAAFNELFKYPIIAFASVCIVAPIYEEIIYRGIILQGLSKRYNNKVAIVVSSILFAVMHMNLHQGINAFLLGIILGYVYIKTKSIYISMFAHFINNGLGIIVSAILTEVIKSSPKYVMGIQIIVVISVLICLYKVFIWFRKHEIILDEECQCESVEG